MLFLCLFGMAPGNSSELGNLDSSELEDFDMAVAELEILKKYIFSGLMDRVNGLGRAMDEYEQIMTPHLKHHGNNWKYDLFNGREFSKIRKGIDNGFKTLTNELKKRESARKRSDENLIEKNWIEI